jgi:succinate dehydrogenase / fumarate reductase flavoprotein subunit
LRDDQNYAYVAIWEYKGDAEPVMYKEELKFEAVKLAQRNYKD